MKGHWLFEYGGKAREGKAIYHGMIHYRNLGDTGPTPFRMPVERWQDLPPVEVECDEDGWVNLIGVDCCDTPRPECETDTAYDVNGSPLVTVCRRGYGCDLDPPPDYRRLAAGDGSANAYFTANAI